MQNYYYLTELKEEPHAVSNYLKKVLREMSEPLCPYDLYTQFRDLSALPCESRMNPVKDLVNKMPLINQRTFVFLIRFFLKVIS